MLPNVLSFLSRTWDKWAIGALVTVGLISFIQVNIEEPDTRDWVCRTQTFMGQDQLKQYLTRCNWEPHQP